MRWRRPTWPDIALAAVLTAMGQLELALVDDQVRGPLAIQHLSFAAMTVPVALRRVAPLPATMVSAAGLVVQTAAGEAPVASGYVAILVLVASLGYHAALHRGLIGLAAMLLAGASYELLGRGESVADLVVNVLLLSGVWFGGWRVRTHFDARIRAELARDRAAREAAHAERAKISRDLHDSVAHALTLMTLQAGAAREQLPPEGPTDVLQSIEDTGRSALVDMHRFLRLLGNDGGSESPGLLELADLTAGVEAAGLPVDLHTCGPLTQVPASLGTTCYRIVQEGLTNALKHSDARQVRVVVCVDEAGVRVEVADDGDVRSPLQPGAGRGLSGLRSRVDLFGGRLDAHAAPDGGWRLSAWLPLSGGAG